MTYLFFNVYWFLYTLKLALLPHADSQSPDFFADLPVDCTMSWMSLCTFLAVYNHVKKIIMGECASVLGQKKSAAHRRVGVFQTVFSLSGKHTQDLWFVHRTICIFIYLLIYLFIYLFIISFILIRKSFFLSHVYRNRLFRSLTYKFYKTWNISKDYPRI